MGSYVDPVTYNFCFAAVTPNDKEPVLREALLELVKGCKPWILKYIGYPDAFHGFLWAHYADRLYAPFGTEVITHPACEVTMEDEWNHLLATIQEQEKYYWTLESFGRHNQKNFYTGPTALGKKYRQYFYLFNSKNTERIKDYEELCDLLNCPNDTLEKIRIPYGWYRNEFFCIELSCRGFPLYKDQRQISVNTDLKNLPEPSYYYYLRISLPRFLSGQEDIGELQEKWCELLQRLGEIYPCSQGNVFMDFPPGVNCINCFDTGISRIQNKHYFHDAIPGYAWGMLLNKDQVALMKNPEQYQSGQGFYRVHRLKNGGMYFQATPNMERMTKEDCYFLKKTFAPYLPLKDLEIQWQQVPSFRLGCIPEEIKLDTQYHLGIYRIEFENEFLP